MSANFNQAVAFFNANELTNAKKTLRKIKAHSFEKSKLEYAITIREGKLEKSIGLGKRLLLETKQPTEIAEITASIARSYVDLGDHENALYFFERSISNNATSSNGAAYINLITLYAKKEHLVNVEKLAPKALSWEQHCVDAQLLLLESATKSGSKQLIEKRIKQLQRDIDKLNKTQFSQYLNYINAAGMEALFGTVLSRFEERFSATSVSDKVHSLLKNKKPDDALSVLEPYLNSNSANKLHYLLGDVFHVKGEYAQAFDAWEKGAENTVSTEPSYAIYYNEAARLLEEQKKLVAKLQQNKKTLFSSEEGASNIFIFGFPRSGTTLLDNILDTQEQLLVLSERNILPKTVSLMKSFKKKYPKDLHHLSASEIKMMRERYKEIIVEEQGFVIPESGMIVEKGPHFSQEIPLIKTLFPNAKLIVTIRHPLDVCLSCFQQSFTMTAYNSHLVVLKDIVKRYVSVFTLLERYENELGIEMLYVRYEDLVLDIESEMKKVFNYIRITPNQTYSEFYKHANGKFITSASRGQTNQPLYTSSMYKWKNYYEQLAPYVDDLYYFIEKFGYLEPDDKLNRSF